ncbi:MAG: metalloregulator ArsR/SmtB family transcription factor [Candidatus Sumerlaeia bacterium]|nr:metalloregulator ArsR/SmtB family transcription factor [Candidatus Sumerlaeia bacterium]
MADALLHTRLAETFQALADANRLRILDRLRRSEASGVELAALLAISPAAVSKHLATLRRVGIVEGRRDGSTVWYRIADESVFQLCDLLCDRAARRAREEHRAIQSAESRRKRA